MSRLKEILDIVSANSEEDVDNLLEMMSPQNYTRSEMSEIMESGLGYDPISYYDKIRLGDLVDQMKEDSNLPDDVDTLLKDKEALVDASYDAFDENRDSYLKDSLDQVIEEKTGYTDDDDSEDDDE